MTKVDVFWDALKFSWYRRLMTTSDTWPEILLKELGGNMTKNDLLFAGPAKLKSLAKGTSNPFWKEVLQIGANMINEASYATPEQFTLFPILDNPLFKIGNRVITRERLQEVNRPLTQVADFLDPETNLPFTHDVFMRHYDCNISRRSYSAIVNSISRAVTKLNTNWGSLEVHGAPRQSILTAIACRAKKGCSKYYRLLLCRTVEGRSSSKQEDKWHQELGSTLSVTFWDKCWSQVHSIKNNNNNNN